MGGLVAPAVAGVCPFPPPSRRFAPCRFPPFCAGALPLVAYLLAGGAPLAVERLLVSQPLYPCAEPRPNSKGARALFSLLRSVSRSLRLSGARRRTFLVSCRSVLARPLFLARALRSGGGQQPPKIKLLASVRPCFRACA